MYIKLVDFLLLIPYLALFFFLAKRKAKKFTDPEIRRHYFAAFWLRMLGCILYTMVIQFYYGYGDSITYYMGSNYFHDGIMENIGNAKYLVLPVQDVMEWYNLNPSDKFVPEFFGNPSGNLVMKISGALSFVSFNSFLIISLFFGFFSFMGQWKLFLVFDEINKKKGRRLLAFIVLYTPSIWFWGSGLMKDSLCLGGLGMIVYYLYQFFIKKKVSLFNIILTILLILMVFIIKSYIIGILFLSLFATFLMVFFKKLKDMISKVAFLLALGVITTIAISNFDFAEAINEQVEEAVTQINNFQSWYQAAGENDEGSKASFSIGEVSPDIGSIILSAPEVIFGCLYRPFIWESRKIIIFFTSLESTMLLLLTLYLLIKTKVVGFFTQILSNEYLFFCFVLSILFSMVIGFTTFNFGTMIRYKIIFLPFFYFMLTHIYIHHVKGKQKKPVKPVVYETSPA